VRAEQSKIGWCERSQQPIAMSDRANGVHRDSLVNGRKRSAPRRSPPRIELLRKSRANLSARWIPVCVK
jgi:hypothetical protein